MRLTIAEISVSRIRHNINQIKKFARSASIVAMIKANAYGHGVGIYTKIAREEGIEYLGFAFIEEAIEVRNFGDNGKIIVLVSADANDINLYFDYSIETCFSSIEILRKFGEEAGARRQIIHGHLFVDTGMHRDGLNPSDCLEFMKIAAEYPYLEIVGICSHLSTADEPDSAFGQNQMDTFSHTIEELELNNFHIKYKHILNSAGLANYNCEECNMVRPGISLHGIMGDKPHADKMNLLPTLSLKSKVILTKPLLTGNSVGYSMKFIAEKDTHVAVVPIGYGDGILRSLTNKMQCLINGKRYNQIGSICMDEAMFDIGSDNVKVGDEVVIIGTQGNDEITVYELADLIGTIPYEVTTLITGRVPRVAVP